ncbi:hypothetical protein [Bacillus bingmayongensis]|uniref:DUF3796 domain-containing protein n=1 Tax=Bacillus bingmayongensis TaxID=1150157 RepID=A0ABU5JRH4_9BACI|nr:hypothetical protein [Bacillus bingmayongensis]MBY0598913.1 hypothetical protein [Bacillus bingmayongensis]MDZ5605786.1 hypothetical protein [Bacillus pseudomycoides]
MKEFFGKNILSYIVILVVGATLIFFDTNGGWNFNNYKEGLHSVLIFCGGFIGFSFLIAIFKSFKKKKKEPEQYPLPTMDERIEKMTLKFMAQVFGLSHFIAFVILLILYIGKQQTISVDYVLYYVFGVLFFTMFFGLNIVKKLD